MMPAMVAKKQYPSASIITDKHLIFFFFRRCEHAGHVEVCSPIA
jgi:hypothetical protein